MTTSSLELEILLGINFCFSRQQITTEAKKEGNSVSSVEFGYARFAFEKRSS